MEDLFATALSRTLDRFGGDPACAAADADQHSYVRYLRARWRHVATEADRLDRPVYIYGVGDHTRWLLSVTEDLPMPRLAGFLDDDPGESLRCDVPVARPESLSGTGELIVLVSSDRFESRLFERARNMFGSRAHVVRLYEELPAGPYDRPESADTVARRQAATRRARMRWGGSDFVGPYERAGLVTGFVHEQWLHAHRERIKGRVLDMSTPRHWHEWIYDLSDVDEVLVSDLDQDIVFKLGYSSAVDLKGDFCADAPPTTRHSFDTVVCCSIIEHCRNPWKLVRNLQEILRGGGTLLLSAPFAYPDGHCRPDYWRFGQDGLRLLAEQAGFTEPVTGGLCDIADYLTDVLGAREASPEDATLPVTNWLIATKSA